MKSIDLRERFKLKFKSYDPMSYYNDRSIQEDIDLLTSNYLHQPLVFLIRDLNEKYEVRTRLLSNIIKN